MSLLVVVVSVDVLPELGDSGDSGRRRENWVNIWRACLPALCAGCGAAGLGTVLLLGREVCCCTVLTCLLLVLLFLLMITIHTHPLVELFNTFSGFRGEPIMITQKNNLIVIIYFSDFINGFWSRVDRSRCQHQNRYLANVVVRDLGNE